MTKKNSKTVSAMAPIDLITSPLIEAKEGIDTSFKLVASALTLVSALAWNEAIKNLFEGLKVYIPIAGAFAPFIWAVLVTIATVVIINRLEKIRKLVIKEEKKEEKSK